MVAIFLFKLRTELSGHSNCSWLYMPPPFGDKYCYGLLLHLLYIKASAWLQYGINRVKTEQYAPSSYMRVQK